jgi:predicted phosphate transport protein (TIGR00153 family)
VSLLEKLMPKTDTFYDFFEKQAALTVEGVRLLKELLEDFTDVQRKVQEIKDVEHHADDVTHRAFELLHTQFITPFDRADIHRLLSRIDDVLDLADAAAERLWLYDVGSVVPEARELAGVLLAQARKMQDAVHGLRDIKDSKVILDACLEINVLENQADTLLRQALAHLFKSGSDTLRVIKWKEVLDLIETATDRAEDVANVIEGVVLENA